MEPLFAVDAPPLPTTWGGLLAMVIMLLGAIVALLLWLTFKLRGEVLDLVRDVLRAARKMYAAKTDAETLDRARGIVADTVAALMQTGEGARDADGRLTPEGRVMVRSLALARARTTIGPEDLAALDRATGGRDVDGYLTELIEAEVARFKLAQGPALPSLVPTTPVPPAPTEVPE